MVQCGSVTHNQHARAKVILDQVLCNVIVGTEQPDTRGFLVGLPREAVAADRVVGNRVRAVGLVGIDPAGAVVDQQVAGNRRARCDVSDVNGVAVTRRCAVAAELVVLDQPAGHIVVRFDTRPVVESQQVVAHGAAVRATHDDAVAIGRRGRTRKTGCGRADDIAFNQYAGVIRRAIETDADIAVDGLVQVLPETVYRDATNRYRIRLHVQPGTNGVAAVNLDFRSSNLAQRRLVSRSGNAVRSQADGAAGAERTRIIIADAGRLRSAVDHRIGAVSAGYGRQGCYRRNNSNARCQLPRRDHEDADLVAGGLTVLREIRVRQRIGRIDELAQRALATVIGINDGVEVVAKIDARLGFGGAESDWGQ